MMTLYRSAVLKSDRGDETKANHAGWYGSPATINYVKSLAKQLAPKGVRVNAVAPGPIWTPLQVSGGATQDKLEKFGGQTPLGRAGQPAELASIYVQFAAADASFATVRSKAPQAARDSPDATMLGRLIGADAMRRDVLAAGA